MNGRKWGRGLAVAAAVLGCSLYASASVDSNVPYPEHYRSWAFAKAKLIPTTAAGQPGFRHHYSHIVSLLENIAAPSRYLRRLAIRTSGKTSFVNVADIDWIRAAENYVQLHTGSQRHLLHVPIGTLEASLDPQMFLRIHRSQIVNTRQILEIESAQHGEFVFLLQGGARLHSSRTYCERIRNWAKNPF